ncbi:MAG: RNA methyltransferase [Bacteroidales bacterium]|nr:RNA methyltransferase [Bacteroidales bacterium]
MELSTAKIKEIRSLREKKFRDELGLFCVEGEKMVAEALASGLEVVEVYKKEDIGEKAMERISCLTSPSPVLAVIRIPKPVKPAAGGLCLALDGVRDPGNMGTILRMADWFGIDTVYVSTDSVEAFNPKVIQASMGTILRRQPVTADIPQLCKEFKAKGLQVFGTFLGGENIYTADLPAEGLIVMGNEAHGISPETAAQVSVKLTIPSFAEGPTAESLNVAVATALTVSEFKRRSL